MIGKNNRQNGKTNWGLAVQNTILVLVMVFVFGFFIFTSVTKKVESTVEEKYVDISGISEFMESLSAEDVDAKTDESGDELDVSEEESSSEETVTK